MSTNDMSVNEKMYIIYDQRAMINPDDAMVLTTADTLEEAVEEAKEYDSSVIYSYDIIGSSIEAELINGKFEKYIYG